MRLKTKQVPDHGAKQTTYKFAWFPTIIKLPDGTWGTIWLEFYFEDEYYYRFIGRADRCPDGYWYKDPSTRKTAY